MAKFIQRSRLLDLELTINYSRWGPEFVAALFGLLGAVTVVRQSTWLPGLAIVLAMMEAGYVSSRCVGSKSDKTRVSLSVLLRLLAVYALVATIVLGIQLTT